MAQPIEIQRESDPISHDVVRRPKMPRRLRRSRAPATGWIAASSELAGFGALCCALVALREPWPGSWGETKVGTGTGDLLSWSVLIVLLVGCFAVGRAAMRTDQGRPGEARIPLVVAALNGLVFLILRAIQCVSFVRGWGGSHADRLEFAIMSLHGLHGLVTTGLSVWMLRGLRRAGFSDAPSLSRSSSRRLGRLAVLWRTAVMIAILVIAYGHGRVAGMNPWNMSLSGAVVLAFTSFGAVILMLLWQEDGLHLALVAGTLLVAGTGVSLLAARAMALAAANPIVLAQHASPNAPFRETAASARLRAEIGDLGDVESVLAAMIAPPQNAVKKPPATAAIQPDVLARARHTYEERCASCHGVEGKGDGLGAFAIKPPPRDYTDPEWQASVTDDELAKAITQGGAAVGKSYMMPASYDLRGSADLIEGLVALVRSFGEE